VFHHRCFSTCHQESPLEIYENEIETHQVVAYDDDDDDDDHHHHHVNLLGDDIDTVNKNRNFN
jgi:hypothetical protein